MKSITKITLTTVAVVAVLGLVAKSIVDDIKATAAAYMYGYPLLMMEETRKGTESLHGSNQLMHSQDFPDGDFRLVVRPNFDTLYSTAWIDLSAGPQVISMPATGDRYYVLPFMDAWTNVLDRKGTSTTGNEAQEIAIVGPNYKGELPEGISSVVESPTNMVWMIGRIQTNSQADVANVAKIQAQMALTPLKAWQQNERFEGSTIRAADIGPTDPMKYVDSLNAQEYFSKLNQLMAEQPPLAADRAELAKFAHLNIAPGENFQLEKLSFLQRWAVEKSLPITRAKVNDMLENLEPNPQGWNVNLDMGNYGTNYPFRMVIAKFGLGALPAMEAAYPNTKVDADGDVYDGSKHSYRLHFAANQLPPVDAFWSLTLYDFEGYLKHNQIDRFSVGDRSELQLNEDGSLDIYIQHQRPKQGISNWLPAPQEEFNMVLRMYLAQNSFLDGEWTIPPIEKATQQ